MSNQIIVNQIESEIARLEQQLEELETRKTRLKAAIRNHRKALKLLNPGTVFNDSTSRAPSVGAGREDASVMKEVHQ